MSTESEKRRDGAFREEKILLGAFLRTRTAESFSELFKTLYPQVLKYFLTRSLDRMAAEELAQNVLFVVYEKIDDLREPDLFFGWLFKIARNEFLQHVRQQQRRSSLARFEPLGEETIEKAAAAEFNPLLNSRFHEWMNHLEKDEREILMLRFIDELSYEELAVALGIPLGTVKWRLHNAKKKLVSVITE